MPPKVLPLTELQQRLQKLSELVVTIAKESGLTHLVDSEKYPELQPFLDGTTDAAISSTVPTIPVHTTPKPRYVPTPSSGNVLQFNHTGDRGGLVNLIATNQGTEPWKNPVDAGLIKVEASSIKKGRPADFVDAVFENQVFYTDNIPYSWICIDFGSYRIKPTYYSFSHRAGPPHLGFFLRNWELHASNDGETWVVVRKHVDDMGLHPMALTASWQIEDVGLSHYRFFRAVIDPEGNANRSSALVMSCFEIYGEWEFEGP